MLTWPLMVTPENLQICIAIIASLLYIITQCFGLQIDSIHSVI